MKLVANYSIFNFKILGKYRRIFQIFNATVIFYLKNA